MCVLLTKLCSSLQTGLVWVSSVPDNSHQTTSSPEGLSVHILCHFSEPGFSFCSEAPVLIREIFLARLCVPSSRSSGRLWKLPPGQRLLGWPQRKDICSVVALLSFESSATPG